VPDIVSQGGDRGPSPWPRWIVAAAVLVLVAVGLAEYLTRPAHPAAPSSTSARPVADSGGPVSVSARAAGPDGITGPVTPWPSGLELPSGGTRPSWFRPASAQPPSIPGQSPVSAQPPSIPGQSPVSAQPPSAPGQSPVSAQPPSAPGQSPVSAQSRPIRGLPPSRSGYQFTRTPGGWAVQASPGSQASCGACAGPPRPVYYLTDPASAVRRVGAAYAVAPGPTAATLWLTSYLSGDDPFTAAGRAQRVNLMGTPVGSPVRLPAGYSIVQGTDRGLLLAPTAPQPGEAFYELWVPSTGQASRVFTGVVGVSADAIAWSAPCDEDCRVRVLSLATGREISATLPGAGSVANAAFSPDGRYLALQVSYSNNGDDGALAMRLAVVSLPAGHLTIVPQTFASSDALVSFGWPAGADILVVELSFTAKVQLAAWHPGVTRLAVASLAPRQVPPSLVLAPSAP
jgi:hypothetical protein